MNDQLFLRFYLDRHVDERFARTLRHRGYDAVTTREVGNERADDEEQLAWAANDGRVVLTSDLADFPRLATEWFLAGRNHAGIVVMVQPSRVAYRTLVRRLLRLADALTADEMVNRVEWLDRRWSPPDDD